ncbi:MAG: DUF3037 domain-containing protein [Chloroflexota bacterium]
MPAPHSYDYALVRVVPRVERGEFVNVGVILFCRTERFLAAAVKMDRVCLRALAPELDLAEVERYLATIPLICAGVPGAGPIGRLALAERFHWLVSPRSTIIQPSPVHSGLCVDPAAALNALTREFVDRAAPEG